MWLRRKVNLKKPLLIAVALLLLAPSFLPYSEAVSYYTVASSTSPDDGLGSSQSCYTGSGHNVIYYNGTHLLREYSVNGTTWNSTPEVLIASGYYFDVVCRSSVIYIAVDSGTDTNIRYMRGSIAASGTATWSANTTFGSGAAVAAQVSSMEINSTGQPHIYFTQQNGAGGAYNRDFYWARSSDGIGSSWTTAKVNSAVPSSIYYIEADSVIYSNDDEMVFFRMATTPNAHLYYRKWTSATSSWGLETSFETCSTAPLNNCTNQAILSAAIDSNDYVSLIYACGATCPEAARQNKIILLYLNGTSNFIILDSLSLYSGVSANNYNDIWYLYWRGSGGTSIKSVNGSDPAHFGASWTPYLISAILKVSGSTSSTYFALVLTNGSSPYTVSYSSIHAPATTTTTATVTTLTTQTTTADTIVDAVANQFAAIMENLFPALIIILVFVYLAYKAGASGEVLAYVFIITLVLTSFINLMPWWITVIVSVIMIAILLNYRQRGGGVRQ